MDNGNVIKVDNISKLYKLYDKPVDRLKEVLNPFRRQYHKVFYALKDISFEVKRGETVGLIGKNGSGKSTLLKVLAGILTPNSGNISVHGKISALLELGAGFNMEYTGIENVYLNGMMMGYSREEMARKIDAILEFADIGEFVKQPVKTYSSGMFVRLAFAVAINVDPDILIVDEALSVGDMRFQKKCMEKINEIKEAGKTILFCSHDMHAVSELCDRVLWFREGKLAEEGAPNKVISSYVSFMTESEGTKERATQQNPNFSIKNSEEVEIDNVRVLGADGLERKSFYTGEDIIFEFTYTAVNGIVEPSYSMLILRDPGDPVALSKSNYHKDLGSQGLVKGRKKIRLTLKNIQFNSGKYYLGISIWDKSAKINFALNRTIEIEIRSLKISFGPMEQKTVFFPEDVWESM
jgi:teichoic acid transport system ATP-binding protein